MDEKTIRPLKIEPKFKNLIRPLQRKEYLQLEQNILSDGCRDPIITWNGVIVDGHNRYEICMRYQIPFAVLEMDFSCEAEAIAWICANQLGRRNISEETRKYLIGKQFEAEKLAGAVKIQMEIISTAHLMRRSSSLPRSKMRRRTLAVRLPRELQRTIISPRVLSKNMPYMQGLWTLLRRKMQKLFREYCPGSTR